MPLSKTINWNLLHTFVVVAETQSISKAARILARGQPAISAALKNLEDQVGHELAERGPKFFKLTEAGRLLHREAREICGAIDRISVLLKDTDEILTGNVRMTIASHMASPILNQALKEFHAKHHRATISCTVLSSPDIIEALANRLIHFGICPVHKRRPDLEYFRIFKEHCGLYCGPTHPLYGQENLSIEDLAGHNAIAYQSAIMSDALQSITEMMRSINFSAPPTGVANNLEEVRRMMISGLGIGAIPVHIAARDVRDGLLWRLPPYEDVMPINVYLVINKAVRPSQTETAFLKVLRELTLNTPESERVYSGYIENTWS